MENHKQHLDEEIWFSSVDKNELSKYDKDVAFALFKRRISASYSKSYKQLRWMATAGITLLFLVSYFSYRSGQTNIESRLTDIVIEAPNAYRTKMSLPDGTLVWLNSASKLSYSQSFGVNTRIVKLVVEAYFEVTHNKELPFTVISNDAIVKVLGTKFNFRDYPSDVKSIVSLSEGVVMMYNRANTQSGLYVNPNQRALLNKQTGQIDVEDYEVNNSIQWIDGRLIFDGELLSEIVEDLERSYNVDIIIENEELMALRFYGDFLRQEQTLSEVLSALAATGKLNYHQDDYTITLY